MLIGKEPNRDTDRGGKAGPHTGLSPSVERLHHMRRNLIALYVAGAAIATLVAANGAVAATWIRR